MKKGIATRKRLKTLYKKQVSYGGKKLKGLKVSLLATSREVTIASRSIPEVRIIRGTRRECNRLGCFNIPTVRVERRTVTHTLVTYITYPDNISQFLINELNRCLNVARNASVSAAIALLPVLIANPQAGLGAVLSVARDSFIACAVSIPGYALIRGQVRISIGYRRQATDWR